MQLAVGDNDMELRVLNANMRHDVLRVLAPILEF